MKIQKIILRGHWIAKISPEGPLVCGVSFVHPTKGPFQEIFSPSNVPNVYRIQGEHLLVVSARLKIGDKNHKCKLTLEILITEGMQLRDIEVGVEFEHLRKWWKRVENPAVNTWNKHKNLLCTRVGDFKYKESVYFPQSTEITLI